MTTLHLRKAPFPVRALPLLVLLLHVGCQDGTGPSVPASAEIVGGHDQDGLVGTTLPDPAVVRILDGRGRPIPGATVRWLVIAGYGSASPATTTTGEDGTASTTWTLGTLAGSESLVARVDGTQIERRFDATARAGAPANIQPVDGDRQAGQTGEPLPLPVVVRVVDAYGNGVPDLEVQWAVTEGDGSLSAPASTTDGSGHATIFWTLGSLIGEQTLKVTAGNISRDLTALGASADFNLILESVHLNQAIQTDAAAVGGVARRPGLLRVFVRATEPNNLQPPVRIQLSVPGRGLIRDTLITGPAGGVPTDPRLSTLTHTWNLELSADDLPADVSVIATVDPERTVPVLDRSEARFPRGDGAASLDVKALHPLRIVFFPIHANEQTGNINEDNLSTYLAPVRQWIPSATIEATVRQPFTTTRDVATGAGWSGLLSDLQAVRVAENATDEYYHGIVPFIQGGSSGIAGIAYVPPGPGSAFRSGLTYDRLPAAGRVLAHELGHNLGRSHAPSPGCQTPSGIDPLFPYPDGGIQWPAYDVVSRQLLHAGFKDFMGYCNDLWTSDYTYAGILAWRRADPLPAGAAAGAVGAPGSIGAAGPVGATGAGGPAGTGVHPSGRARGQRPEPGLLLWGTINASGVSLNPAFELRARPALPERAGPYTVRGIAADGSEVFRLSFGGTPVAHAEDPEEAHFAFFVPLDPRSARAVTRIDLVGPRGAATQRAGPALDPAAPGDAAMRLERAGGGALRLRWAADRDPVAMVRDPVTGRVLAIGRGGDIRFTGTSVQPEQLEILLSDGVVSRRARPR